MLGGSLRAVGFLCAVRGALAVDVLLLVSSNSCSDSDFSRQVCDAHALAASRHPGDNISLGFLDAGCVTNASGLHMLILVGFFYESCAAQAAVSSPETWVILLDACVADSARHPNLLCGIFSAYEPSYAAGYLSGLVSSSGVVGVVGGTPVPQVQQLFNGFILGVRASCPGCRVEGMYVNSFFHPRNAEAVATYLVNATGADVVYGCGGGTGSLAIQRAAQLGSYVVGVDVDEFLTTFSGAPQEERARVLTSVLKRLDVAIGILIDMFISKRVGERMPGLAGSEVTFDYANLGVGLASCHLSCGSFGQDVWDAVRRQEQALSSRSIKTGLVGSSVPLLPSGADPNTFYPAPNPSRPPAARFQAAMSSFSSGGLDFLALFGGTGAGGAALGDLWLYNVQSGKWLDSMHGMTSGVPPPPLAKACAVALGDAVFIFGGRAVDGQQSAALYSFTYQPAFLGFSDATSPRIRHEWAEHSGEGSVPIPVEGPGCAAINATCGVVFGGRAWLQSVNTLHTFCRDGGRVRWAQLFDPSQAQGAAPSAREGVGVVVLPAATLGLGAGDVVVAAGGISAGSESAEVWALPVDGGAAWLRLRDLPQQLLAPFVFSTRANGSDVLVVQATSQQPDGGLRAFVYDPADGSWSSQNIQFSDTWRQGTQQTAMVSSGGLIWAFGGSLQGQAQEGLLALDFQVQSGCVPPLPGHFCVQGRLVPCTIGKYCPAGSVAPSLCPDGHVTSGQRRASAGACQPCPPGSYWFRQLAADPSVVAACMACNPGSFAGENGSALCRPCAPGAVAPRPGQSSCQQCPAGYSVSESAMTECSACNKGEFSASLGASECERCGQGRYADGKNSTRCTDCPVRGMSTRGLGARAAEECICVAGTYMSQSSGTCRQCEAKMRCPMGSSEASLRSVAAGSGPVVDSMGADVPYPLVDPAFWTPRDNPLSVFRCKGPTQCPGGDPSSCAARLEGRACANCVEGFSWDGTECRGCSSAEASALVFPIAPILIAFAVICALYFSSRDSLARWGSWQNNVIVVGFITLNHFQVLSLINSANVPKPDLVGGVWKHWEITNDVLSVFPLHCAGFGSFAQRFAVSLSAPLGLLAVAALAYGLSQLLGCALGMPRLAMDFDRTWNVFFSLIFAFFTGVASTSMALFKCLRSPNGSATLASDPSILCYEGKWSSLLVASVASVLVYCFGCGALFSYAIAVAVRGETFSSTRFQRRWKFLFLKFRPDVHWWAVVLLARGLLENAGFTFMSGGLDQLYWFTLAEAAYLLMTICWMPWRSRLANWCSIVSSVSLIFSCALTSIYAERDAEVDAAVARAAVALGFGPLLFSLVVAGYMSSARLCKPTGEAGALRLQEVVSALADMDECARRDLYLRAGEWDVYHMQKFCEVVESELLGKSVGGRASDTQGVTQVIRATRGPISVLRNSLRMSRASSRPGEVVAETRGSKAGDEQDPGETAENHDENPGSEGMQPPRVWSVTV